MTSTGENRCFLPAWVLSLTLHGAVVGLAFAFATQVKPMLAEDVFKWDVALVEAGKAESPSEPAPSVMPPERPSAKILSQPRPARATEVSQPVKPLEQKIEPPPPTIEPVQPIEREIESLQPREEPVAVATPSDPVESQPVQERSIADALPPEASAAQEVAAPDSSVDAASMQVTKAAAPGSAVKLDNRWVGESLWHRVAELKRYPNSARINGQEGKVILKAIIRSDGQLADISVQKSSGYSALDDAAIEAVKLACPLHMKHPIGKPQIVVSLPIVYSLAN